MSALLLALMAAPAAELVSVDGPAWVEIAVAIRTDADPAESGGLNAVTAAAVNELLQDAPECAGVCSARVTADGIVVRAGATTASFSDELARILKVLAGRGIDDAVVERAVRRVSADRARLHVDDRALAYHEVFRVLFEGTEAAVPTLGSPTTIARTATSDVVANLRRVAARARTRVVVAGRLPDDAEAAVDRAVSELPAGKAGTTTASTSKDRTRLRVVVVDKPDRSRVEAVIGWSLADRAPTADLRGAAVAFGGLPDASLSRAVTGRVSKAFATAHVVARRGYRAGVIEIAAPRENAAAAIEAALAERRTLAQRGLPQTAAAAAHDRVTLVRALAKRDAAAISESRAADWLSAANETVPTAKRIETASRALVAANDLVVIVVASASPILLEKIAALPGVDDVSVVAYDTR